MKLRTISESLQSTTAYHITTESSLSNIIRTGLRPGNSPRHGHVGDGIYVLFVNNNMASNILTFAEYIGVENPVILRADVPIGSLLMDEDSLGRREIIEHIKILHNSHKTARESDPIYGHFPEDAVEVILNEFDNSSSNEQFKIKCIEIIDHYKIPPSRNIVTKCGHYSFDTARCISSVVPISDAYRFDSEWEITKIDLTSA